MAGLFNRLKIWTGLDVIQNSDLNGEFDNIINNLGPSGMSGWSASIAQMQIQTSPGSFGSESLATSTNGEIERLRYQLNAIIGGPDNVWYDQPALSLSEVLNLLPTSPPTNRIVSGAVVATSKFPAHLIAAGSSDTITLQGSTNTPFVVFINGTQYSFTSNITLGSLAQPPASNNTFAINDPTNCDASIKTKNFGAYVADFNAMADGTSRLLSDYPLIGDTVGSNIVSLAGTYQAFQISHSGVKEYFIGYINPGATSSFINITKCWRGSFLNSSNAQVAPVVVADDDIVTLMNLVWVYVSTGGALSAVYSHPRFGPVQPTSFSAGDMWYDTINQTWKQSNGSTYSVANVMLVGICMTDGTNCVASRSFDWYAGYTNTSNIVPEFYSTSEYRTKYDTNYANIYGNNRYFDKDTVRWTTSNLVSGLSLSSSHTYYLYLSETGASFIDQFAPLRRPDLGGYYHPVQSWRCFGLFYYNGSSQFDSVMLAPLSLAAGELLNDKSISISKRASVIPVLTDENAATVLTAPVDSFGISTTAVLTAGVAASLTNIQDTNSKNLTVSINTTGRPVVFGLTPSGGAANFAMASASATVYSPLLTIAILMDGTIIYEDLAGVAVFNSAATTSYVTAAAFWSINPKVPPGNHVFTVKYSVNTTNSQVTIGNVALFAFEI